eukprot:2577060-Amphidinium_carterae.1
MARELQFCAATVAVTGVMAKYLSREPGAITGGFEGLPALFRAAELQSSPESTEASTAWRSSSCSAHGTFTFPWPAGSPPWARSSPPGE